MSPERSPVNGDDPQRGPAAARRQAFGGSLRGGLALVIAYVACGTLALLLALPPGYATAIFPPAGIAVAAMLVGGARTLPWTLLGSSLLNLWVGYAQAQALTPAGLAAAAVIAGASTLQAAAGGQVLRRFIGYPSALDNLRDVVALLVLAPAICLVSASLSVGGLTALGSFAAADLAGNWFTWWIGDTLGVMVLVPIVLAFAGEPRPLWRRRIPIIVVPMLLAFSLVVFVFVRASRWEQDESLVQFRGQSQQLADHIRARLEEQEFLLVELDGFLSHDPARPVSRDEFRRAVANVLAYFPMVQAIEWAPRIEASQRAGFEAAQGAAHPGFRITELDAANRLRPAGTRAYYFPATYLEPEASNRSALGFDLASTPERRLALAGAFSLGVPVATPPLRLVQETGRQSGILLMLRVSDGGNGPGVILSVLRVGDFVDKALPPDRSLFHLRLTDAATRQVVYGELGRPGSAAPVISQTLQYGTREYLLEMQPTELYLAGHRGWQSWTVLVVGIFGTGLLGALLLLGSGYTARVEVQVAERTEALSRESYKNQLFLRNASDGVHILDADGNVVEASDSFCKSLGYDRDEVIGMNVAQWDAGFSPDELKAVVAAQFRRHEPSLFETKHRRKDGSIFDVEVSGMPLQLGGKPVLFNSSRDIGERKRAQDALREEEQKLRGLYELSPLGIALTDAKGRFIEFNEAFRRICGYTEEELKGLDYWALTPKEFAADEQRQLAALARTGRYGPYEKEYLRKDGRRVPLRLNGISVTGRDGRQYVWSIVEDVTQWKAAEALLQEQRDFLAASRDELNEAQRIASLGSWVLDLRSNQLTWSDEIFRIFEIDPTRFGASYEAFLDAIHPDDRAMVDRAYRESLANRSPYDIVHRLLFADGRIKHVREHCETRYDDQGAAVVSRGTVQDITQMRETEQALREQREFLFAILDNSSVGVTLVKDRQQVWANRRMAEMFGYPPEEMLHRSTRMFYVSEAEYDRLGREAYPVLAAGQRFITEQEMLHRDGHRIWMRMAGQAAQFGNLPAADSIWIFEDITERRASEVELNAVRERLALSLSGADLAMTDWDIPSDRLVFGEGWARLLGYPPAELPSHGAGLAALVRPEDAPGARAALIRHLKGEAPSLEVEVRMRHKDGHWVWVLARGMAVERGADGRALRMAGTAMDITARKAAEAEITRLSQWNELLLNSAGEGIYGVDLEGRGTFINPAALAMLGLDREAFMAAIPHELFHHHRGEGSLYPAAECPVFLTLRDGIRREAEDAFIRRSGEVFPVQMTVTAMHDGGRIVGAEVVFQDIARRKAMEAELMRLATTDPLTGAANRRRFLEQLELELARIKRFGKPAVLLMADIDHFKRINDSHGHLVGDAVLKHFAVLSQQRLRRVDLFGRLGGEEFGILMPGTDSAGAYQFAERFRRHVAETPAQSAQGPIPLTVSIGIAEFDPSDDAPDTILNRADLALYRAKRQGRNRVEIFVPEGGV